MPNDPYAPPSTEVADTTPPPKGPVPRSVALAVRLLWLSLLLAVPSLFIVVSRSQGGVETAVKVALQLGLFALAAYLNVCVYRGKNWARVVLLIFTVIGVLLLAFVPNPPDLTMTERLLNAVSTTLDVVAVCLVFAKSGSAWFKNTPR